MEVPRVFAASSAMLVSTFIGTRVVLWKFMWRPVAFAKLSRIIFRFAAACGVALMIISVSSAYWRTGQGRTSESG
jgi:hypothetical protein